MNYAIRLRLLTACLLGCGALSTAWAAPQGSTFTYQGKLRFQGSPLTGERDLQFKLYDSASGGTQIGSTVVITALPILDGVFTAELDFPGAFTGEQRWLEVIVNGEVLTPRQPVNATPVALYALSGNAGATGAQGAAGPMGATGATGVAGSQGVTGATGVAGSQGATGATGVAGSQGATGATGVAGAQGATGATGVAGPQGATGSNGATGVAGPQGATGNDGAMGLQGPAGNDGAQGLQGPQGPQGAQGPQGDQGATGPSGNSAAVVANIAWNSPNPNNPFFVTTDATWRSLFGQTLSFPTAATVAFTLTGSILTSSPGSSRAACWISTLVDGVPLSGNCDTTANQCYYSTWANNPTTSTPHSLTQYAQISAGLHTISFGYTNAASSITCAFWLSRIQYVTFPR